MSVLMIDKKEVEDPNSLEWSQHAVKVIKRSKFFYDSNQLCDVILIAGNDGVRIPAHRLILSASTDYFLAMFTSSMRESKDNEVTMNEMNGKTLLAVVKYCYTGNIEVEENTVEDLLATSCMLQLDAIITSCTIYLEQNIHPSNCLGVCFIAEQFNCRSLLKKAQIYAVQNFQNVCKEQEFFQLDAKQLGKILNSEYLDVLCEEEVFTILMAWVHYDEVQRKKHIPELLTFVRLVLIDPSFIVDHVINVCKENGCTEMLTDVFKWHMVPKRRKEFSFTHNTVKRKSTIGRLMVIGNTKLCFFRITFEMYCQVLQKWTIRSNIVSEHNRFGTVLIGSKLYFVGGLLKYNATNLVQSFDIETLALSSLPSLLTNRRELCVATLNGLLYAIGGHDDKNYLNTVERYDLNERTWIRVAHMKKKRANAGVAVYNNRLYVIGGRDEDQVHNSIECYDCHTNKWSLLQPMTLGRNNFGVAVINGYIYAVGGQCEIDMSNPIPRHTDRVECYCIKNNEWTCIKPLPSICEDITCTAYGDYLIAIGSQEGNKYLTMIMEYDHTHLRWNQMMPLHGARYVAGIVVIPIKRPAYNPKLTKLSTISKVLTIGPNEDTLTR